MRPSDIRNWPVSTQLAAVALVAGLVLDVVALGRVQARAADVATTALTYPAPPRFVIRALHEGASIGTAARKTPFDIEAPVTVIAPPIVAAGQPVVQRPRLVGTVLQGRDSGFVMLELPDAGMKLVRVGERVGELQLKTVRAGEAVFEDRRGKQVSLRAEVRP